MGINKIGEVKLLKIKICQNELKSAKKFQRRAKSATKNTVVCLAKYCGVLGIYGGIWANTVLFWRKYTGICANTVVFCANMVVFWANTLAF